MLFNKSVEGVQWIVSYITSYMLQYVKFLLRLIRCFETNKKLNLNKLQELMKCFLLSNNGNLMISRPDPKYRHENASIDSKLVSPLLQALEE